MFFKKNKTNKDYLLNLKPRTEGVLKFENYEVRYPDPQSIYYEYQDIFLNNIYNFKTEAKNPFIIDAGAFVGMSSLYFKSIYPNAHILCFEPDTKNFNLLNSNIKKNNLSDISTFNVGIGKIKGKIKFYPDGNDGGDMFGVTDSKPIEVDIVQLSDFIDREVDLLKMNIEGMEGDVFDNIANKLGQIKEIIFEYHCFEHLPQNLGNILQLLDKNNFQYVVRSLPIENTPLPFEFPKNYKYFNLVYAKNKTI
jgi:FkbM family methyltransferase